MISRHLDANRLAFIQSIMAGRDATVWKSPCAKVVFTDADRAAMLAKHPERAEADLTDPTIPFPGKISLLINSHNEGPDLLNTILSFKARCLAPLEVLVLADMTTDASLDGLPDYVQVFRHPGPEPLGCGRAKDFLLPRATGDYIHHSDGHNRAVSGSLDMAARIAQYLGCVVQPALGPLRCLPTELGDSVVPDNCYYGGNLILKNGLPDIDQKVVGRDYHVTRPVFRTRCVNNSSFGYMRPLADKFGGWHKFPGRWGNQESGFSWRLWWTDTPLFCARDFVVLHRYQDWWKGAEGVRYTAETGHGKGEYAVAPWERKANRRYAIRVAFDEATWTGYWKNQIEAVDRDEDGKAAAAVEASAITEQRAEFAKVKKKTDAQFFKEFMSMDVNPADVSVHPDAKRAIYCVCSGLGNVMLAIPAMKALSRWLGQPVDVFDVELHQKDVRALLQAQPFVAEVYSKDRMPDMTQYRYVVKMMACKGHLPAINGAKHVAAPYAHKTLHEIDCNMAAVRSLGYTGPTPSARIQTPPPPDGLPEDFVAVCVGTGHITSKQYPHWEAVCRQLKDAGVPIVFIGRAKSSRLPWMIECGTDITENTSVLSAAAVIKEARLYLGVDNGPSHVAAAVGTPSVLVYGPTALRKNHPWADNVHLITTDHRCAACFETVRDSWCKADPRDNKPCMRSITPERVAGKVLHLLNRPVADSMPTREEYLSARQMALNAGLKHQQAEHEIDLVLEEIRRAAPKRILTIGTAMGAWECLAARVCPPGVQILTIDIQKRPEHVKAQQVVAALGGHLDCLTADSHAEATVALMRETFKDVPLDILHIDGDHSEAGAERDFNAYSPLVRPGGLIIMHDVEQVIAGKRRIQPDLGVSLLWDRLKWKYRSITVLGERQGDGSQIGTGILFVPGLSAR